MPQQKKANDSDQRIEKCPRCGGVEYTQQGYLDGSSNTIAAVCRNCGLKVEISPTSSGYKRVYRRD